VSIPVLMQYLLPHRLLSALARKIAYSRWRPFKNWLIRLAVAKFRIDLDEAAQPDPEAYASFNAFFTRALKADARPLPDDPKALLSPADGRISQIGAIGEGRIFQAKAQDFSVAELLGDEAAAQPYRDGQFATIYLSPRDYHRVHMPLAGTLRETLHIPGRLFSVAPFSVAAVPRLFARNERLVCHFDGDQGPFAVVMVGAMLVSSVETVWRGLEIPPYAGAIVRRSWRERAIRLERGAEMGRFNMGSTVIVLLPNRRVVWDPELRPESTVLVRHRIGDCH